MLERNATLPTRFMSSPWPAMPTTSVPNNSGTISDLIIRRKTFDKTLRSVAAQSWCAARALSGKSQPSRMPTTIETRIHCVNETRLNPDRAGPGGEPSETLAGRALLVMGLGRVIAEARGQTLLREARRSVE